MHESFDLIFLNVEEIPDIDCRARFTIDSADGEITVLWDSCAEISTWRDSESYLLKAFPKAYPLKGYCYITGFGKPDNVKYPVYIIPEIHFGRYVVKDLPVAIHTDNAQHQLLVQGSVFGNTSITLNYVKRKFHVTLTNYPHVMKRVMIGDMYIGTEINAQDEISFEYHDGLDMEYISEVAYPSDFTAYAKSKGWSEDKLALDVLSKMTSGMICREKTLLENVLIGWESYKKVFK